MHRMFSFMPRTLILRERSNVLQMANSWWVFQGVAVPFERVDRLIKWGTVFGSMGISYGEQLGDLITN